MSVIVRDECDSGGGVSIILGNLCQTAHFCPVLRSAQLLRRYYSFHIRSVGSHLLAWSKCGS